MEMSSRQNRNEEDELSIWDLMKVVKGVVESLIAKWHIIFALTFLGLIAGFSYGHFRKPTYFAKTTFVLEEGDSGAGSLGSLGGLASMVGIGIGSGGGLFSGDNILELYKSHTMIRKALLSKRQFEHTSELLIDRYIDFNQIKSKWRNTDWKRADFSDTAKFTVVQDSIIKEVINTINKNNLSVTKPDKKLSIINVNFSSKDQYFAKIFSEEIVKCVNDFYVLTKTKRAADNVRILQQKTDSVRAIMNGAIYSAARISDATPNLNPTRQIQRIAPVQKSQFNAEANKEILSELTKNLELSSISLRKETPLIQIIDKPLFPLDSDKRGRLSTALFGGLIAFFITIFLLVITQAIKQLKYHNA